MTNDTAEPTTLELVIDATCYVAPPQRHEYIRRTLTQLWDRGFIQWYRLLMNIGGAVHRESGNRLKFNVILDGFENGSTRGIIGLALFSEERPLTRFIPCLVGDLSNADRVSVTVGEIGPGHTLAKVPEAPLDPVQDVTQDELTRYAARMLSLLDEERATADDWQGRWATPTGGRVN